jgi:adhesin transport system outer membrane protein
MTLEAAMAYTLRTRPDVLISIKQREQANSELLKAESSFYPSFQFNGEHGPERTQSPSTSFNWTALNRFYYQFEITQNIFNGLNTYYSTKAALARVLSSAYEVNSTQQNTAYAVAAAFLNVIREQELIAIARDNVHAFAHTEELIAKRVNTGLGNRAELEQTQGRLAQARSDLQAEIKRYQDAVDDYIEVVGLVPVDLRYKSSLDIGVHSKAQAVKKALIHNPSLRSLEHQITTAINEHKAARSPLYPNVDVVLEDFRGENLDGIQGVNNDDFAVVRANYNLFRGGADWANIKQAAQRRDETIQKMRQVRRQVVKNVSQTWNTIDNSILQKDQLKTYTEKTEFVVKAFKLQYVAGRRTLVDVLNAENEKFAAQRAYVTVYYNLLIAKYQLLANIGNLVQTLNLPFNEAAQPVTYGWLTPGH